MQLKNVFNVRRNEKGDNTNHFLFTYYGNSMFPKYKSGDLLLCKRLTNKEFFLYGYSYMIHTIDYEKIIRIGTVHPSKKEGYIILEHVNPEYAPDEIDIKSITEAVMILGSCTIEIDC